MKLKKLLLPVGAILRDLQLIRMCTVGCHMSWPI